MDSYKIHDDFIKLGQALKVAGYVDDGVEAKLVIQNGEVTVNGEVDTRRGRKLVPGDVVEYDGKTLKIE
ncbi:MAG: RNA-binding S4 domain-containing protein [Lachnospiraceae bacterium]|jgi:ribosome-associated protein|nr:RNA-binding S4 domain-containing protein [Lachnospiraceae bacterium]HAP34327.1 RNA-binding protein [Lachnospiraceae bacterium]HBR05501.1 RNA-binding protein [Lachnospiraceae bacterium]HBZ90644.1 RNA-binding protein [Lachnospiraceae bacterium]